MACFIVPAAEAVITTIATKAMEFNEKSHEISHEISHETVRVSFDGVNPEAAEKIPFSRKMKWLNNLLWGGSALLAFEHIWHGEVMPWFPFLTKAANPIDAVEMLHEMATSGVAMAAIVTVVWIGMVAVTSMMEKGALGEQLSKNKGV